MMSPPPRYVDNKAADMLFSSPAVNIRSPSIEQKGPPVPPKEADYQACLTKDWDRRRHRQRFWVEKEWDTERGVSEEI